MLRLLLLMLCFVTMIFQAQAQRSDFASISFSKADSIAAANAHLSVDNPYGLSQKLTNDLNTDIEKFRAIYKWVSDNIENDYSLFLKNKKKRETLKDPKALADWNSEMNRLMFEKLRKQKSTVCTGYAYLLKELSSIAGIPCEIINGYGRNATANVGGEGVLNHSWNVVQLQDKWYLCDATWSSGAIDLNQKAFVKHYDDTYFLTNPELFIRNHYPQDTAWILLQSKPGLEDFLNRPLVYVGALTNGIDAFTPESFNISAAPAEAVTIRFRSENEITADHAVIQITRSGMMDEFSVPLTHSEDHWNTFSHVFKTSGVYVMQVKLNGEYVFCYRVTVGKK